MSSTARVVIRFVECSVVLLMWGLGFYYGLVQENYARGTYWLAFAAVSILIERRD